MFMAKRDSSWVFHAHPRFIYEWYIWMDKPAQVQESPYYFLYCSVQTRQAMFNIVGTTNEVTNTNDEERTIPPCFYVIGEIITFLNIMTDIPFSISTKATEIRKAIGLEGRTVFYLLRSMDRTWLILREIVTWPNCIHRWSDPTIWSLPQPTRGQ